MYRRILGFDSRGERCTKTRAKETKTRETQVGSGSSFDVRYHESIVYSGVEGGETFRGGKKESRGNFVKSGGGATISITPSNVAPSLKTLHFIGEHMAQRLLPEQTQRNRRKGISRSGRRRRRVQQLLMGLRIKYPAILSTCRGFHLDETRPRRARPRRRGKRNSRTVFCGRKIERCARSLSPPKGGAILPSL